MRQPLHHESCSCQDPRPDSNKVKGSGQVMPCLNSKPNQNFAPVWVGISFPITIGKRSVHIPRETFQDPQQKPRLSPCQIPKKWLLFSRYSGGQISAHSCPAEYWLGAWGRFIDQSMVLRRLHWDWELEIYHCVVRHLLLLTSRPSTSWTQQCLLGQARVYHEHPHSRPSRLSSIDTPSCIQNRLTNSSMSSELRG